MFEQSDLFSSGSEGYHTYRIPAMVVSVAGTVLAFCEGRKESASDHGNIHLLLRRSADGGKTWDDAICVHQEERPDEKVTIGNPCPVVDAATGTIWLAFTRNNQRAFVTHSYDDGCSWAAPEEITEAVKPATWNRYWTGPGHGLQLTLGSAKGRLVIPSYHTIEAAAPKSMRSHMLYSDDHGATWRIGAGTALPEDVAPPETLWECAWHGCECMAVETMDGRLYLAIRNQDVATGLRAYAWSDDGGLTWTPVQYDPTLPEPACQASIIRYTGELAGDKSRVLFANPAATSPGDTRFAGRHSLTVRLSYDDCRSWAVSKLLHAGPAAYSDLAVLADGTILCLYEGGEEHRREWLRLARFDLDWLTDGQGEW